MKTHVDFAHLQLIVQMKLVLTNNVVEADHSRQLWKKRVRPSGSAIITFFWATIPYKKSDETQYNFFEDLVFYICKGYRSLSTCENVLLMRLVLCQYPRDLFFPTLPWWKK